MKKMPEPQIRPHIKLLIESPDPNFTIKINLLDNATRILHFNVYSDLDRACHFIKTINLGFGLKRRVQ